MGTKEDKVKWAPFLRKVTTEEGLLYASQKQESEKKVTTREWSINVDIFERTDKWEAKALRDLVNTIIKERSFET